MLFQSIRTSELVREVEDLTLSNQYQDFIDQMSDEVDLDLSNQYHSDDDESELDAK